MAFGNIDYNSWMGANPQAQGVVTEDIYNQALDYYGKMPSGNLAPNGTMFWGNDVATQLGLPGGSYRTLAGSAYHQPSTQSQQGMGSIYVPGEVDQIARQQGVTGMGSGQIIGDYYNDAGVLSAMGSTLGIGGMQQPTGGGFNPTRSRTNAYLENQAMAGNATANQAMVNDFMSWFNNMGPRAEGPLGSQLNFPQARTYATPYGESVVLPGNITQRFDPNLMKSNPGLFGAGVQTDQLMRGLPLYGDTLHGFVPPWVAASAGLNESNYLQGFYPPAPSLYDDNGYPVGATPGGLPPASYFGPGGYGSQAPGGSGFGQGAGSGAGTGGANPNPFPSGGGSGGSGSGGGSSPWGDTPGQGSSVPGAGGGGTTLPSLPGNPASPTYNQPTTSSPYGNQASAVPGQASAVPSSASEWLAAGANDVGYLKNFANDGQPIDQLPGWQAMVDAQQRNLDRRFADLQESFNVSGNRVSTPFGQAAVDFQTQAGLDQNALLATMTQQALEAARAREFGAAGQLGQMAQQGIGQLSGQDFQSDMWQMQHAYDLAQQMYGGSVQAANALNDTAMRAATQLYGAETAAGMSETDRQMALMQLNLAGANDLSNLWMRNLGLGGTLGQQQYGVGQNEIDRIYNEWLRTRNYNSPLMPYYYAGATGYPVTAYPQQNQSQWPSILGSIAPALSTFIGGFGGGGGAKGSTTDLSPYFSTWGS